MPTPPAPSGRGADTPDVTPAEKKPTPSAARPTPQTTAPPAGVPARSAAESAPPTIPAKARIITRDDAMRLQLERLRAALIRADRERSETAAETERIQTELETANAHLKQMQIGLVKAERERAAAKAEARVTQARLENFKAGVTKHRKKPPSAADVQAKPPAAEPAKSVPAPRVTKPAKAPAKAAPTFKPTVAPVPSRAAAREPQHVDSSAAPTSGPVSDEVRLERLRLGMANRGQVIRATRKGRVRRWLSRLWR